MRNYLGLNHKYDGIITLQAFIVLGCALVLGFFNPAVGNAQNPISLEYNQVELREDFSDKSENCFVRRGMSGQGGKKN